MDPRTEGLSVRLWLRKEGGAWYGVAERDGRLVATSVAASQEVASRILLQCLPKDASPVNGEGESRFADGTVRMLAAIEAGDESGKAFELDPVLLPEPAAGVFSLVAAIPMGYAASYGSVARAAGTIAREVGRLMMNNPLYPIVPCHRVVGSDYSLVGYRGATSGPDLDDKLARLRTEAKGADCEKALEGARGLLVFPVEWVIAKVERDRRGEGSQMSLW
jgi:O-6-methylguanine DNA methyltransferase